MEMESNVMTNAASWICTDYLSHAASKKEYMPWYQKKFREDQMMAEGEDMEMESETDSEEEEEKRQAALEAGPSVTDILVAKVSVRQAHL